MRKVADLNSTLVNFRGKGFSGTATAGQSTNIQYLVSERRLITGVEVILVNHHADDTMHFQVVDVDNVLGYGAGTVLNTFGESWNVCADESCQGQLHIPYPADILAGLYIRIAYTSVGNTNVSVKCNLFLHKVLV